jgi:hypothetical protein
MSYPLIINRVMGLGAFEVSGLKALKSSPHDEDDVTRRFYEQMRDLSKGPIKSVLASIISHAKSIGFELRENNDDQADAGMTVTRGTESDQSLGNLIAGSETTKSLDTPRSPIIGLLASHRFMMSGCGASWDLRVRPSVTACVLEHHSRLSKLWWTFEGVTTDGPDNQTEDNAALFVKTTTALAEAALPRLREAYASTLAKVVEGKLGKEKLTDRQLRVSLADTTEMPFSRLIDAMIFQALPFEKAAGKESETELRDGAVEVMNFVKNTSNKRVKHTDFRIYIDDAGTAAVYTRAVEEPKGSEAQRKFVIAGLASSSSMIIRKRLRSFKPGNEDVSPDLIRANSAARRISARIADKGARELDRLART